MALQKLFPKIFMFGLAGLGTAGSINYILPTTNTERETPILEVNVDTKKYTSPFISAIETKNIIELFQKYKIFAGITGTTIFGYVLFNKIGFGNLMYATRNQLHYGVNTIKDNISNFKNNFDVYKKRIFEKLGYLDEKIDNNQRNIELVIKQKGDEMKCEMKDLKGNQLKTNGMLDLMSDKINIIENQGKYITKGVYLLCNTVINNENYNNKDDVDQIKQYKKFENNEKVTVKNALD